MESNIYEIIRIIIDALLVFGGFGAFIVYWWQKRNEKRDAASLVVLQIEDLTYKLLEVNDMIVDGMINETSFYETLDIINDNQWEKYKHLFVNKIDSFSYKIINSFYEYTLSIKEQLSLAKRLQQNQYFNIQGMLDSNCNVFLMETINSERFNIKDNIKNIAANSPEEEKIKSLILDNITFEEGINITKMYEKYSEQKEILKKITNCDPYISYIPKQIAVTLTKQLTKVNSLDVIGCAGYKKLKKIAKIK